MSWYVAHSLDALLDEINASAPHRSKASDGSIGDADHSSRESDHNPCDCHGAVCARDFTHDPGHGFDSYAFADWLRARCDNGQENRVKYIISNRRIASPTDDWTWRPYTGSNPHDRHVHVSVEHPGATFNDTQPWCWAEEDELTKEDREWIAQQIQAVDAHISASLQSHDEQIKKQLGNHDDAVKDRLAAMQASIDALTGV